jgi:hypothetical protein
MPQARTLYVGMAVQQESSAVASIAPDHGAAVLSRGPVGTRQGDLDQLIRHRQSTSKQRGFVYEAGPGGS